jgi:hypothetical protein
VTRIDAVETLGKEFLKNVLTKDASAESGSIGVLDKGMDSLHLVGDFLKRLCVEASAQGRHDIDKYGLTHGIQISHVEVRWMSFLIFKRKDRPPFFSR